MQGDIGGGGINNLQAGTASPEKAGACQIGLNKTVVNPGRFAKRPAHATKNNFLFSVSAGQNRVNVNIKRTKF